MPFGVHNATVTFQLLIHTVLFAVSGCEAYLDDSGLFDFLGQTYTTVKNSVLEAFMQNWHSIWQSVNLDKPLWLIWRKLWARDKSSLSILKWRQCCQSLVLNPGTSYSGFCGWQASPEKFQWLLLHLLTCWAQKSNFNGSPIVSRHLKG